MQHSFNDLVQSVRSKENEKNLAVQRLEYLKEKETSLKDFLQKAEGQIQGIDESIAFSQLQIAEEDKNLNALHSQLDHLRREVDRKRGILDEKRSIVNILRTDFQQVQRGQFEAEKKVAVADTSIQNLQRTIQQIEDERTQRQSQLQQLEADKIEKETQL